VSDQTPPAPAPAPVPLRPVILPPQPGVGCFAKGCIVVLILGFIFTIGAIGSTWYLCRKAAVVLTSNQPVDLKLPPPDRAQIRAAEGSVDRLKQATARGEETTIGFTGADLNALIDHDPDLDFIHGHVRIDIANSVMSVKVSAPLEEVEWKRLRGRWLNGSAELTISYDFGMFQFDVQKAEINGHPVPESIADLLVSQFNKTFNTRFHDSLEKEGITEFWDEIKSISLEGDRLVITTQAQ
jgi:hypothetical protein